MKRHIVSLSFDDGFAKSFESIADIYEECGLKACLNIISSACEPVHSRPDEWHNAPTGTWDLWNRLAKRGHEIMPHSYNHSNCAKIPLDECIRQIDMCLESFDRNLKGFNRAEAVFNFPYNSSTPEVEEYLLARVRAVRTGGSGFNPFPSRELKRITTCAYGPGNCEAHLEKQVEKLLAMDKGWLVYNTHGLDEEGWGPVSTGFLKAFIRRLSSVESVEQLPVGAALRKYPYVRRRPPKSAFPGDSISA